MRRSKLLVLLGFAGMIVGCADETRVSEPRPATNPSYDVLSDMNNILSNAGITVLQPQVGEQGVTAGVEVGTGGLCPTLDYAFSAVRHVDATFSGELELFNPQNPCEEEGFVLQREHAQVLCFTIEGNTARLGAVITESNVAFNPPGEELYWTVQDNGDGNNGLPDFASNFGGGPPGTAYAHCASGLPINMGPVLRGDVQIHS